MIWKQGLGPIKFGYWQLFNAALLLSDCRIHGSTPLTLDVHKDYEREWKIAGVFGEVMVHSNGDYSWTVSKITIYLSRLVMIHNSRSAKKRISKFIWLRGGACLERGSWTLEITHKIRNCLYNKTGKRWLCLGNTNKNCSSLGKSKCNGKSCQAIFYKTDKVPEPIQVSSVRNRICQPKF